MVKNTVDPLRPPRLETKPSICQSCTYFHIEGRDIPCRDCNTLKSPTQTAVHSEQFTEQNLYDIRRRLDTWKLGMERSKASLAQDVEIMLNEYVKLRDRPLIQRHERIEELERLLTRKDNEKVALATQFGESACLYLGAVEVLIEALEEVKSVCVGGFVQCSRCGDQESTADLDFMPSVHRALAHPVVLALKEKKND